MEDIEKLNEYVEIFAGFRSLCKDKVGEMSDSDILTLFAIALKDIRGNAHYPRPSNPGKKPYYNKNPVRPEPRSSSPTGSGTVQMTDKQRKLLIKLAGQLGESEEELMDRVRECKTSRDLNNLVGEYIRRANELKKKNKGEE